MYTFEMQSKPIVYLFLGHFHNNYGQEYVWHNENGG